MNKHFRDDCLYVYEGGCMRTSEPEKVKGQLLLLCEYTYVTRQRAGELIRYLRKIIQIALCKTNEKKRNEKERQSTNKNEIKTLTLVTHKKKSGHIFAQKSARQLSRLFAKQAKQSKLQEVAPI